MKNNENLRDKVKKELKRLGLAMIPYSYSFLAEFFNKNDYLYNLFAKSGKESIKNGETKSNIKNNSLKRKHDGPDDPNNLSKETSSKFTPEYIHMKQYVTYAILNCAISVLLSFGTPLYIGGAVKMGTLDFRKWDEIINEKNKRKIELRSGFESRTLEEIFKYFDSDNDGQISKKELKEGLDRTKDKPNRAYSDENRNIYDMLNIELGLKVEKPEN